jgi:hypothetical protein
MPVRRDSSGAFQRRRKIKIDSETLSDVERGFQMASANKSKRQIGKPTKRQLGFQIGQNILGQISNLANGVRQVLEKGQGENIQTRQPQPIGCAPADVKRSLSPEQLAAVEEFISTWATEPEPTPKGDKK